MSAREPVSRQQVELHRARVRLHQRSDMHVAVQEVVGAGHRENVGDRLVLGQVRALRAHGPFLDALDGGHRREVSPEVISVEPHVHSDRDTAAVVDMAVVVDAGLDQRQVELDLLVDVLEPDVALGVLDLNQLADADALLDIDDLGDLTARAVLEQLHGDLLRCLAISATLRTLAPHLRESQLDAEVCLRARLAPKRSVGVRHGAAEAEPVTGCDATDGDQRL